MRKLALIAALVLVTGVSASHPSRAIKVCDICRLPDADCYYDWFGTGCQPVPGVSECTSSQVDWCLGR